MHTYRDVLLCKFAWRVSIEDPAYMKTIQNDGEEKEDVKITEKKVDSKKLLGLKVKIEE